MVPANDCSEPTAYTRRSVAKAAAWSLPILAAAVATPGAAATTFAFDVSVASICTNGATGPTSRGFSISITGTLPAGSSFYLESTFPGIKESRFSLPPGTFQFFEIDETYLASLTTLVDLTDTVVFVGVEDSGMIAGAGQGWIYRLGQNFEDDSIAGSDGAIKPGIASDLTTQCFA